MSTFYTKKGNTAIAIAVTLSDPNGLVDLTGATVVFRMRAWDGISTPDAREPAKVEASASPDADQTANKGEVTYAWQAADVNTPGLYACEWEVTFAGGAQATFPRADESPSYDSVRIWPSLA